MPVGSPPKFSEFTADGAFPAKISDMNAVIFQLGPLHFRAFSVWWGVGCALTAAILLIPAWQRRERLLPYVDTLIGAGVLALIGARIGHIALHADYFAVHADELLRVSSGGLNWHGGLIGAVLGGALVGRLRRAPMRALWAGFGLGLPFLVAAGWAACGAAACAYGVEVQTLADLPMWYAAELPDVYGTIAPRLNTTALGLALAGGILLIVLAAHLVMESGRAAWVGVIGLGVGMALISTGRADYPAPALIIGLDALIAAFGLIGLVVYRAPRLPQLAVIDSSLAKR